MDLFIVSFIAGSSFLLSFLLFFHPSHQNIKANRWLGIFVFIIGAAFISIFINKSETENINRQLNKFLISLQFLSAPSFYIAILYFVKPRKVFKLTEWVHFIPFILYFIIENALNYRKESYSTYPLFTINKNNAFLIRDILPIISLIYLVKSYITLANHKKNLKLIVSNISDINLDWLVQFLFILALTILVWINDVFFELPYLTEATNFIYAISIFFLAYFSIKQKAIFTFKEKDLNEISEIFEEKEFKNELAEVVNNTDNEIVEKLNSKNINIQSVSKSKQKRLNEKQIDALSIQLNHLMETEKLFLDNDLSLPTVAEKLGIGIHEASFLINETTNDNFYNFINKFRIAEAKKLLNSSKINDLTILAIAYESGFNSKTTFNTTFKKVVGISPSQYSKSKIN